MDIDYEQQLKNRNDAYDKIINDYKTEVGKQQQQLDAYQAEQTELQKEQTDFAIEQIEQKREQTEKDYIQEQQAAYGDYKRQTDPYGVNAEQMAALGLSRSGYSESSNVAMYTAYQNRVAVARASFQQATLEFDNAIKEAKLTNDINLAKIAAETLEKKLALSMESVVYLGNLELEKVAAASSIKQTYYNREQDILAAQQESMGIDGNYIITDNEGKIFGGNDIASIKASLEILFPNGVITNEDTWNDLVNKYGEEAVREWGYRPINVPLGIQFTQQVQQEIQTRERPGTSQPNANANSQGVQAGQTEQPKYNYADKRVNAYFTQEDTVKALQWEYDDALGKLEMLKQQPNAMLTEAQQEYVDTLSEQLGAERKKLGNMPKPTESSVYLSREKACKKAKEALEIAENNLAQLKVIGGVSAGAIKLAEEKVRNAQKAYNEAYASFMAVDKYEIQKGMSDYAGTFRTDRLK